MDVQKENLEIALRTAIRARERLERDNMGYSRDSALLAGWRKMLLAVEYGESLNCKSNSHTSS